jgi:hypothetical protein
MHTFCYFQVRRSQVCSSRSRPLPLLRISLGTAGSTPSVTSRNASPSDFSHARRESFAEPSHGAARTPQGTYLNRARHHESYVPRAIGRGVAQAEGRVHGQQRHHRGNARAVRFAFEHWDELAPNRRIPGPSVPRCARRRAGAGARGLGAGTCRVIGCIGDDSTLDRENQDLESVRQIHRRAGDTSRSGDTAEEQAGPKQAPQLVARLTGAGSAAAPRHRLTGVNGRARELCWPCGDGRSRPWRTQCPG